MYRQEKKYYKKAFFCAFIMAVVLLLPFVIVDGGYFVYYGDYNAQQIPFYKTCIRAVQSGNFGWNWQTDLGVNFIGSYSFYTLGSPFFWLAAMFPASVSQYLMAPLLALKLGLASLFAFIYIRRFVKKPDSAVIGGILYAFSGFSLYNIFFNHFHEAIVFFPLLLIALEEAVINKRRGMFALAVALNAFVNYFFFIGECVFLLLYFIIRMCCDSRFRIKAGDFFCLAFESVVGVAVAGVLFVPSIFQVLDVPRSTQLLSDSGFLFFSKPERYGLLLESMFFPPSIPARSYIFTEADARWSSVALYLPLFSMAGAIAFIRTKAKHWAKALLLSCLVAAFIPGLNAAFTLFNSNYYTRWFYMPELVICLATVLALEQCSEKELKSGLKFSAAVVGIMSVLVLFCPVKKTVDGEEQITVRLLDGISFPVFMQIFGAIIFLLLFAALINERREKDAAAFFKTCTTLTVVCSMLLGYYFVGYGRALGPYIGDYNRSAEADINISDPEFFRMEAVREENNINMNWNMSSLKSFTSIIPSSIFELYDMLGIERTVNSAPDNSYYALRSLTGVKYLMVSQDEDPDFAADSVKAYQIFEPYAQQGGYDIYINNYAFPMGYAYDSYVTADEAESHSAPDKLMCRAVVLTEQQAEKYADILTALPEEDIGKSTLEDFKSDAEERIAAGITDFTITKYGFTAAADYDTDELVVFSVPYDKGWSALVNGSPVEVEKVNGGFVAARVPKGSSKIEFVYTTPGLVYGIMLTAGGAVLYGLYMLIQYAVLKKKPRKYAHLYDMDIRQGVRAHSSYIGQLTRSIEEAPEKGRVYRPDINEAEYEAVRRSLAENAAKPKTDKKPAFYLNDGEEAYEILKAIEKKR